MARVADEPETRESREVEAHLASCTPCTEQRSRLELVLTGIRDLAPKRAPESLEGQVVGALQAGGRQLRAVAAVRSLEAREAPEGLARALATGDDLGAVFRNRSLRAPAVLDRLVEEELADPARASAQRTVGRLARRRAPLALGERLRRSGSFRGRRAGFAWLAAAAALLALVQFVTVGGEAEPPRYSFEVVRSASLADLDPFARAFVEGLSATTAKPGVGR